MQAEIDGRDIYYEVSGDEGVPVVFVHSLAGSADDWRPVRAILPAEFRTAAFDSRGVGRSAGLGSSIGHSMSDLTGDLAGLLDDLGIDRAYLVGASMGGGIVQHFALEFPSRVTGLILVSTSSEFDPALRARFAEDAGYARKNGLEGLIGPFLERWFSPDFHRQNPAQIKALEEQYRRLSPEVFAQRCLINAERDITARLGEIRCPVLFVGGALDPGLGESTAGIYAKSVKSCDAVLLGGVSHCIELEAPVRLAHLIECFVKERIESVSGD